MKIVITSLLLLLSLTTSATELQYLEESECVLTETVNGNQVLKATGAICDDDIAKQAIQSTFDKSEILGEPSEYTKKLQDESKASKQLLDDFLFWSFVAATLGLVWNLSRSFITTAQKGKATDEQLKSSLNSFVIATLLNPIKSPVVYLIFFIVLQGNTMANYAYRVWLAEEQKQFLSLGVQKSKIQLKSLVDASNLNAMEMCATATNNANYISNIHKLDRDKTSKSFFSRNRTVPKQGGNERIKSGFRWEMLPASDTDWHFNLNRDIEKILTKAHTVHGFAYGKLLDGGSYPYHNNIYGYKGLCGEIHSTNNFRELEGKFMTDRQDNEEGHLTNELEQVAQTVSLQLKYDYTLPMSTSLKKSIADKLSKNENYTIYDIDQRYIDLVKNQIIDTVKPHITSFEGSADNTNIFLGMLISKVTQGHLGFTFNKVPDRSSFWGADKDTGFHINRLLANYSKPFTKSYLKYYCADIALNSANPNYTVNRRKKITADYNNALPTDSFYETLVKSRPDYLCNDFDGKEFTAFGEVTQVEVDRLFTDVKVNQLALATQLMIIRIASIEAYTNLSNFESANRKFAEMSKQGWVAGAFYINQLAKFAQTNEKIKASITDGVIFKSAIDTTNKNTFVNTETFFNNNRDNLSPSEKSTLNKLPKFNLFSIFTMNTPAGMSSSSIDYDSNNMFSTLSDPKAFFTDTILGSITDNLKAMNGYPEDMTYIEGMKHCDSKPDKCKSNKRLHPVAGFTSMGQNAVETATYALISIKTGEILFAGMDDDDSPSTAGISKLAGKNPMIAIILGSGAMLLKGLYLTMSPFESMFTLLMVEGFFIADILPQIPSLLMLQALIFYIYNVLLAIMGTFGIFVKLSFKNNLTFNDYQPIINLYLIILLSPLLTIFGLIVAWSLFTGLSTHELTYSIFSATGGIGENGLFGVIGVLMGIFTLLFVLVMIYIDIFKLTVNLKNEFFKIMNIQSTGEKEDIGLELTQAGKALVSAQAMNQATSSLAKPLVGSVKAEKRRQNRKAHQQPRSLPKDNNDNEVK